MTQKNRRILGVFTPSIKWPECEANHSVCLCLRSRLYMALFICLVYVRTGFSYGVVSCIVSQALWPFLMYCASPSEF
jgi:hypothetical protein